MRCSILSQCKDFRVRLIWEDFQAYIYVYLMVSIINVQFVSATAVCLNTADHRAYSRQTQQNVR